MKKLMAAPYILLLTIFFIVPLICGLFLSFYDGVFGASFVGFSHYTQLIKSDYFIRAISNTALFILVSTITVIPLSFIIASAIFDGGNSDPFLLAPMLIPFVVPSMALYYPYVQTYAALGENQLVWVTSIFLWKQIGLHILIYFIGIILLDPHLDEAAQVDGASYFRRVICIRLPLLWPYHILSVLLAVVNSNRIFNDIYVVFGENVPSKLYMIQNLLFDLMKSMKFNSMMVIEMLFLIGIVLILLLSKLNKKVKL